MARFNPTQGLEITAPEVETYLYSLLPARDPVLAEMEARAEKEKIPIVGPLVGRLLEQLAAMVKAKRVMELGSAIGYSTIWLARAVGPGGRVFFTDGDPAKADQARDYAKRAGVADRIEFLVGDAVTKMAETKGDFDVVFCDIDKPGYPEAFAAASKRIRSGGLFVCDNTLLSGQVTKPPAADDRRTLGVLSMNRATYADESFFTTILPIRDGVTVALKK